MIVDQLFPKKLNESLADQIMQSARAAGLNPRVRGTPDQERQRTQDMMAQRAQERDQQARQAALDDARNLMSLKSEYKQMKDRYERLGGSNWQYADREQNLSDGEREARSMEPALNRLASRIHAAEKVITKESRQRRKINEAQLMEDPVYRNFKTVGRYIAERRMSEKEILQVFADAEAGMTDKATGANRTMLGRGKDTAMDFAGGVANALKGVWAGIQNSVPVAAVDVAYDQATDALAGLAGGQKGSVMQAIKKYRNLAKQYPKTAGLAKGALVAITGLATGGAGLPAIAALVYGLDSAIKGEKLSDIALKAGGAAATAWAGQKIASAFGGETPGTQGLDPSQFPAYDDAGNLMPGFHINPENGQPYWNGELGGDQFAGLQDIAQAPGMEQISQAAGGPMGGGTYTIQNGDQLGYIAQANGVSVEDIRGLNPQINFAKPLQPGMEIQLPPAGTPGQGSVWSGYQGGMYGDKVPGPELLGGPGATPAATTAPTVNPADVKPFGAGAPDTSLLSAPGAASAGRSLTAADIYNGIFPPGASEQMKANLMALAKQAQGAPYKVVYDASEKAAFESVQMRRLAADKLIDQKSTVMNWALNESLGIQRQSINITTLGAYTVFENVDRCRRAIVEAASAIDQDLTNADLAALNAPGGYNSAFGAPAPAPAPAPTAKKDPRRPEYYRPDMPGGPGKNAKPGLLGRGLNWLDKAAGKVGGALSNFGHQFTTGVTKEKLKMNWHQAGKPSDSDQLAAFLVKQGVPDSVVSSVFGKMGIPYTAPQGPAKATKPTANTAKTGGAQQSMPYYGNNPKTDKPWTRDELLNRNKEKADAATPPPPGPVATTTPAATEPKPATAPAGGLPGYNYNNVMQLPGMQQAAKKPEPAKPVSFAGGPTGYGKTTTSFKGYSGIPGMQKPAAPATPSAPKAPGIKYNINLPATGGAGVKAAAKPGQLSPEEYIKRIGAPNLPEARIVQALKKPVAEMLSLVETKEDVKRIKQFIDQTFVKYGAVSESAFAVRNRLIEHVTQVGAQRRREFARKG